MATTHMRTIGNLGGVDPRAGVSGSWKSRSHHPIAQKAQFCMRKMWKKVGKKETRCKIPRRCKKCMLFSNYREEKRTAKKT